jgi:hypothetical protein
VQGTPAPSLRCCCHPSSSHQLAGSLQKCGSRAVHVHVREATASLQELLHTMQEAACSYLAHGSNVCTSSARSSRTHCVQWHFVAALLAAAASRHTCHTDTHSCGWTICWFSSRIHRELLQPAEAALLRRLTIPQSPAAAAPHCPATLQPSCLMLLLMNPQSPPAPASNCAAVLHPACCTRKLLLTIPAAALRCPATLQPTCCTELLLIHRTPITPLQRSAVQPEGCTMPHTAAAHHTLA